MQQLELDNAQITALCFGNDELILFHLVRKITNLPIRCFVEDKLKGTVGENIARDGTNVEFINIDGIKEFVKTSSGDKCYIFYAFSLTSVTNNWEEEKQKLSELREYYKGMDAKWEIIVRVPSRFSIDEYIDAINLNFKNESDKARIIVVRDGFGPFMNLTEDWEIARHLRSIHDGRPLIIEGDGLTTYYPVFIDDDIDVFIKSMFSDENSSIIQEIQ